MASTSAMASWRVFSPPFGLSLAWAYSFHWVPRESLEER